MSAIRTHEEFSINFSKSLILIVNLDVDFDGVAKSSQNRDWNWQQLSLERLISYSKMRINSRILIKPALFTRIIYSENKHKFVFGGNKTF